MNGLLKLRGKLTMPQFMALDLYMFGRANRVPPEHPNQVDTDDRSWYYVRNACAYIVHGNTLESIARHASRQFRPLSKNRTAQIVHRFVRHNRKVLRDKHGLEI